MAAAGGMARLRRRTCAAALLTFFFFFSRASRCACAAAILTMALSVPVWARGRLLDARTSTCSQQGTKGQVCEHGGSCGVHDSPGAAGMPLHGPSDTCYKGCCRLQSCSGSAGIAG